MTYRLIQANRSPASWRAGRPSPSGGRSSKKCRAGRRISWNGVGRCPAALLGQLRCDLKPRSIARPLTRPTTDPTLYTPRQVPAICGQEKSRVEADELPFWQALPYGGAAWYESWNRRNLVEGLFGNVKNDASQNVTRGRFRVMGLAKVSLMALFVAMAANLRLTDTFHLRQAREERQAAQSAAGIRPRTRKPRWRTRQLTAMRQRMDQLQAQRQAADQLAGEPPRLRALPDPPP